MNYNPVPIGLTQIDPTAATNDVPKIAQLGANTIGTYNLGKFDWYQTINITAGENFYNTLYPVAEANNLKIIVAYFSNQTIDWTNATQVARASAQYQELVIKAKDKPSTLMYLIGNEIFGRLSDNNQKKAYATWIGQMVNWTHTNDPNHPVTYADDALKNGLGWLSLYSSNLDIYSINNYEWATQSDLSNILAADSVAWPNKPILLHEFGTDSLDVPKWAEDESAQAAKVKDLVTNVQKVYDSNIFPLIGQVYFEYTDQWDKIGSPSLQDKDTGWPWLCTNCFDAKANEDFWGISRAVGAANANNRVLKSAYYALQQVWAPQTPTPIPTPLPTPVGNDTTPPTVSITNPLNASLVTNKASVSISANASDNVGVIKVEFYINNVLLCADTSQPYTCIWKVPKRVGAQFTILVKAYDTAGNVGTNTVSVISK